MTCWSASQIQSRRHEWKGTGSQILFTLIRDSHLAIPWRSILPQRGIYSVIVREIWPRVVAKVEALVSGRGFYWRLGWALAMAGKVGYDDRVRRLQAECALEIPASFDASRHARG